MNNIIDILTEKVKERHIAIYILNSIDSYETHVKHMALMRDIRFRIIVNVDKCLFGKNHSIHKYYFIHTSITKIYHLNGPSYIRNERPFLHVSKETFYYNTITTISENKSINY